MSRCTGVLWVVMVASGCNQQPTLLTVEAAPSSMMQVSTPAGPLGSGWYPNVEVDARGRVHLAYVDADAGDVVYRVSDPATDELSEPVTVEHRGAVGHYLRMALAPGGAPVLLYGHQDDKSLHLAHRPADRDAMKAAGADVDTAAMPPLPERIRENLPAQADNGFVIEEVVFADDAGRGASLAVDANGRTTIVYYTVEMLRLARRPSDVAGFGPSALGHWLKFDVDRARASPRTQTDIRLLSDGSTIVSYCDDAITDGRLRVATIAPDATEARPMTMQETGKSIDHDGAMTAVLQAGSAVEVGSWHPGTRTVDVVRSGERGSLVTDVAGPAVVRRSPNGSTFVLFRTDGADAGIYLAEIPPGATKPHDRVRLARGQQGDGWLDLALRPDGRPVAFWFAAERKAAWLYRQ
jgi:hypothetical protein